MITYYTSPIKRVANEVGVVAPRPDLAGEGVTFTPGLPTQIKPVFYGDTEMVYTVETDE